jgi:hypothetical protein
MSTLTARVFFLCIRINTVGTVSDMVTCRLMIRCLREIGSPHNLQNNKRLVGGADYTHSDA